MASKISKSAKEIGKKVEEIEQGEEYNPMIVACSKKSYERSITNQKRSESIKETTFEVILS